MSSFQKEETKIIDLPDDMYRVIHLSKEEEAVRAEGLQYNAEPNWMKLKYNEELFPKYWKRPLRASIIPLIGLPICLTILNQMYPDVVAQNAHKGLPILPMLYGVFAMGGIMISASVVWLCRDVKNNRAINQQMADRAVAYELEQKTSKPSKTELRLNLCVPVRGADDFDALSSFIEDEQLSIFPAFEKDASKPDLLESKSDFKFSVPVTSVDHANMIRYRVKSVFSR